MVQDVSYWDHRKPVRRTRAVDVDEIARIAVELLDGGGLRALTLRAVAHQLDVAPASLYSRVTAVEDLFDLALDRALGLDPEVQAATAGAEVLDLMHAYYRHLVQHPWACQVIAMRAPRGPHYLRLSERLCVLLAEGGSTDPLGDAYALSNFVIGSATTTPTAGSEQAAAVDTDIAPLYASLHASHNMDAEAILHAGLRALLRR
ncbi:MAG TPA: TetR/AcrR family transcriptional regulator C-terminal domain-containing protein [Candidatus Ruania gallistercoris]|uniref:TetR/AcrR family transcriptional regulator C-terminal domain-containing protein n=1 Tax=Candidatus Ruania gallistercoris TaxID=2838746 RepID=A0A9D2EHA6_9MICO|nr:TetR/AcrR family transcriptional regulator C-terminal domain-containing protein [Candidatus Ruania gallistercoris]